MNRPSIDCSSPPGAGLRPQRGWWRGWLALLAIAVAGCDGAWNNPNPPARDDALTYYSVITNVPPKHLDPAVSYASDEALFTEQIYDPPLGYQFLKRPFELEPLAAEQFPEVEYFDRSWQPLPAGADNIAYSRWTIRLKEDLYYQPHPAFALAENGEPLYLFSNAEQGERYRGIPDFAEQATRRAMAKDFIYGIKRLADPTIKSPMMGLMSQHIVGLDEFTRELGAMQRNGWLNLEDIPMKGLEVIDDRTFTITLYDVYPQFKYWLAMHFFAPVPMEVDRFYHNPGFREKNLTLDWWPVGTGAYMMVKNDPNSEIVLARNPNYREDFYPSEGSEGDLEAGWLDDAGKQVPFIDRAHFRLEKEVLPLWTKFLQGYYDRSGEVHANTKNFFDQAFVVGAEGIELSEELAGKQLSVSRDLRPSLYYWGFNMRDPVVGGYSEERRKLRLALSIAYDMEEYIAIFQKGNAIAAQSLLPPGIPGHVEGEAGINTYQYDWVDGAPRRKSIEYARQLMEEAGYPGGRDVKTGEPLRIYIDVQSQAVSNASMDWTRRQIQRLGVQVEFRPADWNRTREKLRTGNTQIYSYGWLADYPDPENFLFLLHSPKSPLLCNCDGPNKSNYQDAEYDALYDRMRTMEDGPERDALVTEMVELWRRDAVWLAAYHPLEFYLNNQWVYNTKRHGISRRSLKYLRLDPELRAQRQAEWNQPVVWPLVAGTGGLAALVLPGVTAYRRRQRATVRPVEG